MRNEEVVELWLNWYRAGAAPVSTVRVRRSQIGKVAAHVELLHATEDDLVAVLASMEGQACETRRAILNAMRSFYGWALRRGFIAADPTVDLRAIRVPQGLPKPIAEDDLTLALSRADRETRLMLLLGAYAGLRRAEISRVHSDDVTANGLRVLGKGGKVRRVPLHPILRDALAEVNGWAFPSPRFPGEHVQAWTVGDRLEKVLPQPWTAHSLRHRFATMAYRGTHDLRVVQTLLGHTKPETTARYTLTGDDDLIAAVNGIAA
jgi:integrase